MSRKSLTAAVFAAVAAGFFALPASAAPASPGNLRADATVSSATAVNYGGYRRGGHNRGVRLFFGGGHGRQWGNYGGGRRGHARRGYSEGYGYGGGRGHGGGYGGGYGGGHNR